MKCPKCGGRSIGEKVEAIFVTTYFKNGKIKKTEYCEADDSAFTNPSKCMDCFAIISEEAVMEEVRRQRGGSR